MAWLIGSFVLFILFFLIIIVIIFKKTKSAPVPTRTVEKKAPTLDSLIQVLKSEKKDVKKVEAALSYVVDHFPFPENENAANQHFKFVYFYAKNPLTTAKMIVNMQKRLSIVNPKYVKQIENFQMVGVEARNK